jgi:hypothetical protein
MTPNLNQGAVIGGGITSTPTESLSVVLYLGAYNENSTEFKVTVSTTYLHSGELAFLTSTIRVTG